VLADLLNNNVALTDIDLAKNRVGDAQAKQLCSAIGENSILTRIDLSSNELSAEGIKLFHAAMEANPKLEVNLSDNRKG
jgi:hypothetical protein